MILILLFLIVSLVLNGYALWYIKEIYTMMRNDAYPFLTHDSDIDFYLDQSEKPKKKRKLTKVTKEKI